MPQVIAQMRQLGSTSRCHTYSAIYNPKMIEQLGKAAEGLIVTSLAPGVAEPGRRPYHRALEEGGQPRPERLPYTQYLYDAPYMVAALYDPRTRRGCRRPARNLRKAMVADQDLRPAVDRQDHRVRRPHRVQAGQPGRVKDGKWAPTGILQSSDLEPDLAGCAASATPHCRVTRRDDWLCLPGHDRSDPLDLVCDRELLRPDRGRVRADPEGRPDLQFCPGRLHGVGVLHGSRAGLARPASARAVGLCRRRSTATPFGLGTGALRLPRAARTRASPHVRLHLHADRCPSSSPTSPCCSSAPGRRRCPQFFWPVPLVGDIAVSAWDCRRSAAIWRCSALCGYSCAYPRGPVHGRGRRQPATGRALRHQRQRAYFIADDVHRRRFWSRSACTSTELARRISR